MTKKLIKSALLLMILISTFNCASTIDKTTYKTGSNSADTNAANNAEIAGEATASEAAQEQQTSAAPDAVVKDLYKTHDKDNGAILNGKSRKLIDKYFDKTLADYLWKDLTTHQDEVGVLDFDPFYNAQDTQIKNFKIGEAKTEGERGSVPVSFQNFDRKDNLTYSLVRQNGAWKISDIKYTDGSTLLGYFKEDAKNNASSSTKSGDAMFEGTYKVGETTCTVKPIKMAFEVKWARGSGTMIFFYDETIGEHAYSSEDTGKGGRDKFIFNDDTFTTGKFIRGSDGREMLVSKIK